MALVVVGLLAGATACSRTGVQEVEEVSANFDSGDVRPFLERLQALVDGGFAAEQIDQIIGLVEELEPDQEAERRFSVEFQRKKVALRVVVYMDDVDAADLYFFTIPELAAAIEGELDSFFEERGM